MFELLDPGCEGVIPTSKLDSIPLDRYREAFQYITSVGESLDMPGMEAGEEYVYMIQVEWSDGTLYTVRRTYGDFFSFQTKVGDSVLVLIFTSINVLWSH